MISAEAENCRHRPRRSGCEAGAGNQSKTVVPNKTEPKIKTKSMRLGNDPREPVSPKYFYWGFDRPILCISPGFHVPIPGTTKVATTCSPIRSGQSDAMCDAPYFRIPSETKAGKTAARDMTSRGRGRASPVHPPGAAPGWSMSGPGAFCRH